MKHKLIILIFTISCCVFSALPNSFTTTYAVSDSYAQVNDNSSYLYKTSSYNEDIDNKYCLLPKSFFVKILNNYNDLYYKAQYKDLTGYVKKSEVSLIKETPQKPYPTTKTISIKSTNSCYLRNSPKIKTSISNVITTIPSSTKDIEYIAKMMGEEAIDLQGTMWYLVRYNNQLGYIYNFYSNTIILDEINAEQVTVIYQNESMTLTPLSDTQNLLLIFSILLPILVVLYLLYTPNKTRKISKKSKNNKQKLDLSESIQYYNDIDL